MNFKLVKNKEKNTFFTLNFMLEKRIVYFIIKKLIFSIYVDATNYNHTFCFNYFSFVSFAIMTVGYYKQYNTVHSTL